MILDDEGRVERIVAAHDVGKALNPVLLRGQVEGGVHMGLGMALTEAFETVDGIPVTDTLKSLGIIPAAAMPPVETILVEVPQPEGPFGAKGMGEAVLVPTAAAVAGALYAFDGVRRTSTPMRDSPAARALLPRLAREASKAAKATAPGSTAPGSTAPGSTRRRGVLMSAVTPGLVCAHHHLYSALARGMPAPPKVATSFQEILEQVWWRLDTALDLEMIRWSAMLGALEALENGTTAIIDHHESPNAIEGSLDVIAAACAEVGVRSVLAYGITDRHGPDGARRGLAENERFIRAGGRGLVGIHAAFTCSDASLRAAADLAADLGVGVHVHVCEGVGDIDAPARLAGLTRDDWLLAHCVHLPTDHALRGTILHNPMSNLNNAVGYANPARFDNPVALGTDGIGGNVLESFRLAYVMQRSVDVTCGPGTAWSWLETGWDLVPEARDDEVTWSYDPMDPWHIAFTPGIRPLRVVVGEEVVFADGRPTRVDADEIRAKAREQAARLHARL